MRTNLAKQDSEMTKRDDAYKFLYLPRFMEELIFVLRRRRVGDDATRRSAARRERSVECLQSAGLVRK